MFIQIYKLGLPRFPDILFLQSIQRQHFMPDTAVPVSYNSLYRQTSNQRNSPLPLSNPTISDAIQQWLKQCKRNDLERATMRSYRNHADIHIKPKLGDVILTDLDIDTIEEFLDEMLETSSRSMVKKVLVSLRSIVSVAVKKEWISRNIVSDVDFKISSRHRKAKEIPTKAEINLIIAKADKVYKPLFTTAILTGMRISELRGLRWCDIDWDKRLIRVTQRADRYSNIGSLKTASALRNIPMSPLVFKALTKWKAKCPESKLDLVFPNGAGNPESLSNIYNRGLKPLLIANGIVKEDGKAKYSMHQLRHAAASLFIEQKWSLKKIQTIIGHASISTTMDIYGHLFDDAEEDQLLMEKLEADLLQKNAA